MDYVSTFLCSFLREPSSHSPRYILCCTSRELLLHSGEPATVVFIYLEMDARLPV